MSALGRERLGGLQRGDRDRLCELAEVLGGGSKEEPVSSTRRAAQPEPVETQDALEVREQHLDFLPYTPRSHVSNSLSDFARNVSSLFVDRTRDLAGRHLRTKGRI